MIGSREFIEDFILIKGNTDSGPVPSLMAAYGEFLGNHSVASSTLKDLSDLYAKRLNYIIPKFRQIGLRPACETEAGFFTLWKVPQRVLGRDLRTDPSTRDLPLHEAFNRVVISETGIVGVHFQGPIINGKRDSLIRYAVCADVLSPSFQDRFESELARLQPEYDD
jgi:aspartate/methionine/tyrosine aminotransferase